MTLKELMRRAGTDPEAIEKMAEAELRTYLEPLFPQTRPSMERQAAVAKAADKKKAETLLKSLDMFDKLLGGK